MPEGAAAKPRETTRRSSLASLFSPDDNFSGTSTQTAAAQAVTGELTNLLPPGRHDRHDEDQDGLDVTIGFSTMFQGLRSDWRRRSKHYTSDFRDGFRWQTLSAGLFTFFGVLATTISLGQRIQRTTAGQMGFTEYMMMNSVAGIIYSLVETQPYVVVQPTGPITMLLEMLSECAAANNFEFLPFVAATGLWVCIWLTLCSIFNVSKLISYMSRFTGEVFAVFIGTAYMRDGIEGLAERFTEELSTPSRESMLGDEVNSGDALMSLNIGLLVLGLASWLATGLHGPRLCVTPLRNFFAAYALTIAIFTVSFLSHFVFERGFTVDYLHTPDQGRVEGANSFSFPTRVLVKRYIDYVYGAYNFCHNATNNFTTAEYCSNRQCHYYCDHEDRRPDPYPDWILHSETRGRSQLEVTWWVGLPSDSTMYAWGLLYSIPIVIFFIVDQLVSAGLAQPAELRMRKGRYYHSGLLLVGLLNLAGPLFGLPFVTGALPQSPELTIQMAETTAEREKRLELEQQLATAAQQQQPSSEGSTASSGRTGLAASLLGGGKAPAAAEPAAAVPQIDRRPLVIETRLAPLLAYVLLLVMFVSPRVLEIIPAAAVEGTLIYVGLTGIFSTQLWSRIILLLSDWSVYSPNMPFAKVKPMRMHLYTLLQLVAIGLAWLIQSVGPTIGLLFPLFIMSLVPARFFLLPMIFSLDELHVLDPGSERLDEMTGRARTTDQPAASTTYGAFEEKEKA